MTMPASPAGRAHPALRIEQERPGHDDALDPYNSKSGKPQIDKAKEELKLCNKPDGFSTAVHPLASTAPMIQN